MEQRNLHPDWFNAPVPTFGDEAARLVIVGLAPGLKGANRTGRPFTGDYAGVLLYETLREYGLATGEYRERPDDDLVLRDTLIANAVRCVPPENKPVPAEIRTCNRFLEARLSASWRVRAVLALGRIAHDAVLLAMKERRASFTFAHGARHSMGSFALFDSYHCSRYNTNTGVLTPDMFRSVIAAVAAELRS
jgi:uracil-DNA glycosylase